MSDRLRRLVCRCLFAVLCVLPTCLVLKWILTPTTPLQWENQIKRQLGIRTRISSIQTPLPQLTILGNVTVLTGHDREQLDLGSITIANTEKFRQIGIHKLSLKNGTLASLIERVYQSLSDDFLSKRIHKVEFGDFRIVSTLYESHPQSTRTHRLHDLSFEVIPKDHSLETKISFRLSEQTDQLPVQIAYVKHLDNSTEDWTLDCQGTEIPVMLLSEWLPNTKCLGDDATFTGLIQMSYHKGRWDGKITGRIGQADFTHLVLRPFNQWLTGSVDISIDSCVVEASKIVRMSGSLQSDGGEISIELLSSLRKGLKNKPFDETSLVKTQFSSVYVAFDLQQGQIMLHGLTDLETLMHLRDDGIVIKLLSAKQRFHYPIEQLIQALVGTQKTLVPIDAFPMTSSVLLQSDRANEATTTRKENFKSYERERLGALQPSDDSDRNVQR